MGIIFKKININELKNYNVAIPTQSLPVIEKIKSDYKEFSKYGELGVYTQLMEDKGFYSVYTNYLKPGIKYMGYEMILVERNGMYTFCPLSGYDDKHTEEGYKPQNAKPNRFSKPTKKIVENWFNYFVREDRCKVEFATPYLQAEEAFREKLEKCGEIIDWEDENKGRITKGNMTYLFEIFPRFISEKVYTPSEVDLDTFLKMADNGISKPNEPHCKFNEPEGDEIFCK